MRAAPLIGRRRAVVLVAHGSRDPRAAASTEALASAVARRHPGWTVHATYLDHAGPRPLDVLAQVAADGHTRAVMVPVLLTAAYHGKVDVPAVVREAPLDVDLTSVLGPADERSVVPSLLVDALIRQLPPAGLDGVVLAAAGTRSAEARVTVERVAMALGARLGLPCRVAYASAAPPDAGTAVTSLGVPRVGVASYFLAPGRLYDAAMESARAAGAVVLAEPLGAVPELVALVADRVNAVDGRRLAAA